MFKFVCCLLSLFPLLSLASSVEDYSSWPTKGELKLLKVEQQDYVSLWLSEQTPQKRGTVILLPDWGVLPTSPDSVDALRLKLPENGWETAALLPPAPIPELMQEQAEAAQSEAFQLQLRQVIEAAVQQQSEQFGYQLLVAQGVMGAWLVELFQQQSLPAPDGLVLINAYTPNQALNQKLADDMAMLSFPVLDLYSANYNQWSAPAAELRAVASGKSQKRNFRQAAFVARPELGPNAAELNKAVYGWLTSLGWY